MKRAEVSRPSGRVVLLLALLLALPIALSASDLVNFTTVPNTDFAVFGACGVRGQGTGSIVVSGITPPVARAYLYWHGPTDDPGDTNASVTFNGTPVTGANIGNSSDNCWLLANSKAYRADVTALVAGNGTYTLANFRKDGPPLAEINGVSLVIFYDDGSPANNRDVVIFNGNDSNIPNAFDLDGWNATLAGINYTSGTVNALFVVSDGQAFPDEALMINGQTILPNCSANWEGNTVPDQGTASSTNGGLWDQKSLDLTTLFSPGLNTLVVQPNPPCSDCLSLIAVLFDLPAGAAPCSSPCVIPTPPSPVVVTDCSGTGSSPVTTTSGWTQINMPSADVILNCALAQLPGTDGARVLAHSIKVGSGGSVSSTGKNGIQLIAGSAPRQCNAGATVDLESTSVNDGNTNGGIKIAGCGDVVVSGSAVSSKNAVVTVTSSAGRVCATTDTFSGNALAVTASGDLTMHGSNVTTTGPRDSVKLVSNNGSVLAGGASCGPNEFQGGIESNMAVTANGQVDLTSACVEIAENITITASGSGFACATDVIINLSGSEIRNDFGKPGTITVTACGGTGKIDIGNAILVDNGVNGGGSDPNRVANLNGSTATQAVNCAGTTVPTCTTRPLDAAHNPVSANPADRSAHNVVGVPRCDT